MVANSAVSSTSDEVAASTDPVSFSSGTSWRGIIATRDIFRRLLLFPRFLTLYSNFACLRTLTKGQAYVGQAYVALPCGLQYSAGLLVVNYNCIKTLLFQVRLPVSRPRLSSLARDALPP